MKRNIKEAKKHLERARELSKRIRTGFEGLTMEQAIAKIRKSRQKLWEEKLAHSS